jgi:hypothetical protein
LLIVGEMKPGIAVSLFAAILVTLILTRVALCGDRLFYKEVNLIGGYSDRDGWTEKGSILSNSLGFEYFKKFSGEEGDYLTTDLQMRAVYDREEDPEHPMGIEIHNAWI